MKRITLLVVAVFATTQINAQFIKEKSINASIGYGMSFPYDNVDISSSGFYAQGELVLTVTKWFDLRPYVGFISTKTSSEDLDLYPDYKSLIGAVMIGGKTRVSAPIPWFAPYLEIGIGTSIGSFKTITPFTNIDKNGLALHIPFSIGVALGPKNNVDIAFTYNIHNSVEQVAGAMAVGLSFPIDN